MNKNPEKPMLNVQDLPGNDDESRSKCCRNLKKEFDLAVKDTGIQIPNAVRKKCKRKREDKMATRSQTFTRKIVTRSQTSPRREAKRKKDSRKDRAAEKTTYNLSQ